MKRESTLKYLLMVVILFCLSGCTSVGSLLGELPVIRPIVYYDDYGTVWTAAISALDEDGYVIAQMRRSEGYISTDKRERGDERVKMSLRFYNTEDNGVLVKITEVREMYHGEVNEYGYGGWKLVDSAFVFKLATESLQKNMNNKLHGNFKIEEQID